MPNRIHYSVPSIYEMEPHILHYSWSYKILVITLNLPDTCRTRRQSTNSWYNGPSN